jgi:hypothetical protein
LPQPPKLRVLALGGETSPNQAIRLLSSRRNGSELALDIEITRGDDSASSINLPLTVTLNGVRSTSNVTLAGQNLRFRKVLPIPPREDSGYGWLSIPGDGNLRDNAAFFAYGPARPVKSLLVAPPGEAANYLAIAAAPGGIAGQAVERLDPAQLGNLDTTDVATIFWAAPLPTGATAEALTRFLSDGGEIVFFAPTGESTAKFLDVQWSAVTESEKGEYFILDSWDHDDGPLRDGIDGSPIPAERLKAIKRRQPEGDAAVLARWDDGEPFISRRIADHGTAWFIGSLPDYTWSNLGDADVLLPAVQRIVAAGADRFDASYLTTVGSDPAQPLPGETRTRIDDYGTPDPSNAAYESGVFRLGERLIAINRPAAEDDPEILSRDTLNSVLEGTNYTLLEDRGTSAKESISRDVWRGFLIAMLFFLIAEALLCLPKKPVAGTDTLPARPTNA